MQERPFDIRLFFECLLDLVILEELAAGRSAGERGGRVPHECEQAAGSLQAGRQRETGLNAQTFHFRNRAWGRTLVGVASQKVGVL